MKRRKKLKNKILAVLLIIMGALSLSLDNDATFFVFSLLIGIPLFFSKEDRTYSGGVDNHV